MSIDLDRITHPLRLARGSHQAGSGKGCAMNVISYINGDTQITDYPACSAQPLAAMVQQINDILAGPDGFLTPQNSIIALDLGWATVGTAGIDPYAQRQWESDLLLHPTLRALSSRRYGNLVRRIADHNATVANGKSPRIYEELQLRDEAERVYAQAVSGWPSSKADYEGLLTLSAAQHERHIGSYAVHFTEERRGVEAATNLTRWAIQHWRDLMELDTPTDSDIAAVNAALDRMYV